jgi:ParB family chromosome partitioning protein
LRRIPIEAIQPNPDQPRKRFSQQTLEELADSIRAHGLLQPIIVTPLRGAGADRFQLVAGERRWRAAQLAGLQLIPALVRDATRGQSLELALIENLQREDLNPMEAARVFERLVEDFGLKHEEIAQRTGKDRATITNFLRLLRLPAEVQELVSEGKLSTGHAKALLAIASPQEQRRLAKETVAKDLSVRVVEKLAAKLAGGEAQSKQSKEKQWDANIRSALADLERALGTRVRLQGSAKKGKLLIEYYSPEDLMRIYDAIVK